MPSFDSLLDAERTRNYPRLVAALTIAGFAASHALGPGLADVGGVPLGADFTAFWSGARLWLDGADPYDLHAQYAVQVAGTGVDRGFVDAFVNPPWALPIYAPFAALPYVPALLAWWVFQAGLLVASALIARRALAPELRIGAALLTATGFFPVLAWFLNGQATGLLLVSIALCIAALRAGRDVPAGVALALGFAKPHVALPFLVMWATAKRPFALAAFGAAALVWMATSELLVPGGFLRWRPLAATLFDLVRDPTYPSWGLSNTFGAAVLLFDPLSKSVTNGVALAASVGLFGAIARAWSRIAWEPGTRAWDLGVAGTVAAGLVASPHLFAYDLALLLVPVALLAAHEPPDAEGRPLGGGVWLRRTALLWIACFAGPYVTAATCAASEALVGARFGLPITAPVVAWWGLGLLAEARRVTALPGPHSSDG